MASLDVVRNRLLRPRIRRVPTVDRPVERALPSWLARECERRGWEPADLARIMATDNTVTNAGSGGDTIRDWDRSGVKTQVMALDGAAAGEAELLGLGSTKYVALTSAGVTTASTAYTSGDQIGTEMSGTFVRTAKGAIIQSGVSIDKAKVMGPFDLYVFGAATTPASDNAANSWSDADMLNLLGIIHFSDVVISANNYAIMPTNLPLAIKPASGTTLYFDAVTRTGNSFFGAAGDLVTNLGISQD